MTKLALTEPSDSEIKWQRKFDMNKHKVMHGRKNTSNRLKMIAVLGQDPRYDSFKEMLDPCSVAA